jgi:SAM-dependent methyltransferase
MLSWFPSQVKEHGLLPATGLLWRVMRYRIPVLLRNWVLPARVECPGCGWKGRSFFDYVELGYRIGNGACPSCDSHSRHRALYLWLTREFELGKKRGRALVFAPERALAPLWDATPHLRVIKTDIIATRGVHLLSDVMRLPFASRSIELIWCHHVLEQVEDDGAAMRELLRVLKASGELVISAGITRLETLEFDRSNPMMSGNRRLYGADFPERLKAAGFQVQEMSYNLSAEELQRYGVYPERFYYCTIGS